MVKSALSMAVHPALGSGEFLRADRCQRPCARLSARSRCRAPAPPRCDYEPDLLFAERVCILQASVAALPDDRAVNLLMGVDDQTGPELGKSRMARGWPGLSGCRRSACP